MVRTGSLRTQSARHRVDHGTICGRNCANSGHYKPLRACVHRIFVNSNSSRRRPEKIRRFADLRDASRTTNHRRQPSPPGSIRHDRDHRIATTPRRSRLLLLLNRLPSRSLNCAVRPSTQACNRHTQRPSQPSIPAAVACLSRYCSRRGASRSFAHTFGVSQIPSQGRGASAHHRPRVRSLAAFGRRRTCTWLR